MSGEASRSVSQDPYINFDDVDGNEGWWNEDIQATKKGDKRWTTLSHNGVMFPPPYEPHGIPIFYAGKEFQMTPEEEEIATMFAKARELEYYTKPVFRNNFFRCWLKVLNKRGQHPIRELELCDFDPIWQWHCKNREERKAMSKEEKKKLKDEQAKQAAPFKYCLWDGRKEEVANYRVEPPDLFRGRGEHPKQGVLKRRVQPEDITINIDENAKVPPCPPGHKWREVVHDHTKTWLAMWEDNVTGERKYVMLAPSATIKGLSDREKFERAKRLHEHIGKVRDWYTQQMKSGDVAQQQLGVATYFIDKLALRVGNEKSEDEADTVGCCSLRVEHCSPQEGYKLHLNFLGKDSIRYDNVVTVEPLVHELVGKFLRGKTPKDMIFDRVDPADLNANFKQFMEDLTAKVFRTYNASKCLEEYFKANPLPPKATLQEKLVYFNKANTEVAILCNHQKSVSRGHHKAMAALAAKEEALKNTVERLRKAAKDMGKKDPQTLADEFFAAQDVEQREWLEAHGSEEEKAEFDKEISERGTQKVRVKIEGSPARKSTGNTKSGKKVESTKRKSARATRTIDDLADDDDQPLFALAVKKEEPADDDDVPVSATVKKSSKKPSPKASAKKTVATKTKKDASKAGKKAGGAQGKGSKKTAKKGKK